VHSTIANRLYELDAYLPTTAMWVLILRRQLWVRTGGEVKEVEGPQWEAEVTKERPGKWVRKVRDIAGRRDLLLSTQDLASRALTAMEAVMRPTVVVYSMNLYARQSSSPGS
jgi:hypothetical protein